MLPFLAALPKNVTSFVPRMEIPIPKMAIVILKVLHFQVGQKKKLGLPILDWMLVTTVDHGNNCSTFIFW